MRPWAPVSSADPRCRHSMPRWRSTRRVGISRRARMPETAQKTGNAEVLTGRIAEYQELLDVLDQRPGLTIISSDPWSGTSALLAAAIDELHGTRVLVDARSCADSRDLAMVIADT